MENLGSYLVRIPYLLPQVFIVAACIYYLTKQVSAEGLLLLFGSIISLLISFFNFFFIFSYRMDLPSRGTILTIVNAIDFLASVLFAVGFFILIHKNVKNKNFVQSDIF